MLISPSIRYCTSKLYQHKEAQLLRLRPWMCIAGRWRPGGEVPHQTQLVWNRLAEEVEPHRPPFDHLTHITGQNLFVSAYHGFVTLRDEHVPLPAPGLSEEFPGGGRLCCRRGINRHPQIRGALRIRNLLQICNKFRLTYFRMSLFIKNWCNPMNMMPSSLV